MLEVHETVEVTVPLGSGSLTGGCGIKFTDLLTVLRFILLDLSFQIVLVRAAEFAGLFLHRELQAAAFVKYPTWQNSSTCFHRKHDFLTISNRHLKARGELSSTDPDRPA